MKQFYSGMADFLQMMVDQNLKQYGKYTHPLDLPDNFDRELYNTAFYNGFTLALKRVNRWLETAIKPEEEQ